ncbi:hypothetical protein [Streptomyces sp. NBC_00151]|uniref:hypothetical protein n=1 Tax=Streptomyces sp. NBC_00151 TaxID=2975669 RepID=UPI002DDAC42F|nr:hypothetical protein [Streptomyces sp. NBC_00151]WRZ44570.1 hypothetical protein OG915_45190 [Streptomyces sp. NBC_00151]
MAPAATAGAIPDPRSISVALHYTHIKSIWKLTTTTDDEKTALSSMIDTCTE